MLASRLGVQRRDIVSPDLSIIFAHGHGLHWALQNHVLSAAEVLVGQWRCLECAQLHGGVDKDTPKPQSEEYVLRPAQCSRCGQKGEESWQYVEQTFRNEEYRIQGHPDGFLKMPGISTIGVLEAKSVGGRTATEIKGMPKLEHVVQIHIYLWFTGLSWGKILYWDKAANGLSAYTEHTIRRDEETIDNIKRLIHSIWAGVGGGPLPSRICETVDDDLAKECPLRDRCFEPQPTKEWAF